MSRSGAMTKCAALLGACLLDTGATAQDVVTAQTPTAAVGRVGQRQTRDEAAPNIEPVGRVESRISNRVQSRLRNRIDRFYDPQGNASSPFIVASDQVRNAGR